MIIPFIYLMVYSLLIIIDIIIIITSIIIVISCTEYFVLDSDVFSYHTSYHIMYVVCRV